MVNCWDVCLTTRFLIAISTGHRERATSHKRLRARDYYTSSTLIGGKGEACPSSVHTMLKGPTEYVNARWDVKSTWIPTWRQLDHVSWSLGSCFMLTWTIFKNRLLEVGPTQKMETMALRTPLIYSILSCVRTRMNRNSFE